MVCDNLKHSLICKGDAIDIYSTKQFCTTVLSNDLYEKELWRIVWASLAPPKVEVFCWQLMRGGIAVKDQLTRRGLLDWDAAMCTFYKFEVETIVHLFFSCNFS